MTAYHELLEQIARQSATVRMLQKSFFRLQSKGQSSRAVLVTCKQEEHKLDLLLAKRAEAQATDDALAKKNLYQQRELGHIVREGASE